METLELEANELNYGIATTKAEDIRESMWYQYPTNRINFDFLYPGCLAMLKQKDMTIIGVNHFNENCRILYNNTNSKNKLSKKEFMLKLKNEPDLIHNLMSLYKERIERCINKGKHFTDEDYKTIRFELFPAMYGGEVDCWKVIAEKIN